jgi:hypothetical protein
MPAPAPSFVGSLTLPPLNTAIYLFLVKIKSPFVKGGEADAMDAFRAVYCLVTPLENCLALWKDGPETYDAAVLGLANAIQINELEPLADKILTHIKTGFADAVTAPAAPATEPAK